MDRDETHLVQLAQESWSDECVALLRSSSQLAYGAFDLRTFGAEERVQVVLVVSRPVVRGLRDATDDTGLIVKKVFDEVGQRRCRTSRFPESLVPRRVLRRDIEEESGAVPAPSDVAGLPDRSNEGVALEVEDLCHDSRRLGDARLIPASVRRDDVLLLGVVGLAVPAPDRVAARDLVDHDPGKDDRGESRSRAACRRSSENPL